MQRQTFALLVLAGVGYVVWRDYQQTAAMAAQNGEEYTVIDALSDTVDNWMGTVTDMTGGAGPVANMQPSQDLIDALKRSEGLRLDRYDLGDGGYTIGYGHFGSYMTTPARITREQAEAMLLDDVESRGAKWVRLYVKVPLTQNQFDALVSIAFNMRPSSFKKFADAVNAGQGIETMADVSVGWVRGGLQNGIRNRRDREVAMFNRGIYG